MNKLIKENYIFLDLKCNSKDELFEFIASRAKGLGICDDEKALCNDLWKREAEVSTGLQDGFAIPHARSVNVKKTAVFFIRNQIGIEWETFDGGNVHEVFVLLVSNAQDGDYLNMIAQLAVSLLDDDFKESVKSCHDPIQLHELFMSHIYIKEEGGSK